MKKFNLILIYMLLLLLLLFVRCSGNHDVKKAIIGTWEMDLGSRGTRGYTFRSDNTVTQYSDSSANPSETENQVRTGNFVVTKDSIFFSNIEDLEYPEHFKNYRVTYQMNNKALLIWVEDELHVYLKKD